MTRPGIHRAWAVYGRNGGIYVTYASPHQPMEGRLQIYKDPFIARRNAIESVDRIFEVEIRPVAKTKTRKPRP